VASVAEGQAVATGQFDGDDFSVPDLRVGEIRALRTFRLSRSGRLHPVAYQAGEPWEDGANSAHCLGHSHTPAAPGCRCGFWAYGTHHAARDHAEARRVLAVVACWGRVVPGTRGVRAQHARIEAIWLSARVRRRLVRRLRERYPSATFYRRRRLMLRRHPPTRLESYDPVWLEAYMRRLRRPRWEQWLRWEIDRLRLWWQFYRAPRLRRLRREALRAFLVGAYVVVVASLGAITMALILRVL
jgi:hypothetical protein